jgi:hypothetical protein
MTIQHKDGAAGNAVTVILQLQLQLLFRGGQRLEGSVGAARFQYSLRTPASITEQKHNTHCASLVLRASARARPLYAHSMSKGAIKVQTSMLHAQGICCSAL